MANKANGVQYRLEEVERISKTNVGFSARVWPRGVILQSHALAQFNHYKHRKHHLIDKLCDE